MKYFLPLILSVFIFSQASGQITITLDDLVNVGDTVNIADVDDVPPGFDPGPPGASQHWDFSGFIMDTNYYLYFVDPASTPFAASFPTSNMVIEGLIDSAYIYTTRNSFVYQIDGLAGTYDIFENVVAPFEPPEIMFSFPLNYLDSMQQTIVVDVTIASPQPPADSLRLKVVSEINDKVDAWGTLTTPVSTYDVLRIREIRIATDSVWMKLLGFWLYVESLTEITLKYTYMANDLGIQVAEIESDTSGNNYNNISYLLAEDPIFVKEEEIAIDLRVFPNPASSVMNVAWDERHNGSFLLMDMQGKTVLEKAFENTSDIRINTSALPQGFYLYQLAFKGEKDITSGKVLVR
jgi:hypothetical protein